MVHRHYYFIYVNSGDFFILIFVLYSQFLFHTELHASTHPIAYCFSERQTGFKAPLTMAMIPCNNGSSAIRYHDYIAVKKQNPCLKKTKQNMKG